MLKSLSVSKPKAPASPNARDARQVVTCLSGGFRFAISTENLSGVYQVARSQLGDNLEVIDTPEGRMPVVSAATLLSSELGFKLENSDEERDLIAIRNGDLAVALRVADVARPVALGANGWHRLPRIANPSDDRGIVSAIATIKPASTDPNEAFTLVLEPLIALGMMESSHANAAGSVVSGQGKIKDQLIPQRRGSGQLLAFVPEDVPRKALDFVFALPLAAVAEVVNAHETFQSPLTSNYFEGYVMWRDIPVPVVNLAACFGLKEEDHQRRNRSRGRRLVIARAKGQNYVAFYTQTQMHSMKTPESSLCTFDQLNDAPLLGSFKTNFGAMVIPDLDRILANNF